MTEGISIFFTHKAPNPFLITLVSSSLLKVFKDNTLANFKNFLSEEKSFARGMESSSCKVTFLTQINNVTDNNIVYYQNNRVLASMEVGKDKITRPYLRESAKLTKGEHTSVEQILDEIRLKTELKRMNYLIDPITKHLSV